MQAVNQGHPSCCRLGQARSDLCRQHAAWRGNAEDAHIERFAECFQGTMNRVKNPNAWVGPRYELAGVTTRVIRIDHAHYPVAAWASDHAVSGLGEDRLEHAVGEDQGFLAHRSQGSLTTLRRQAWKQLGSAVGVDHRRIARQPQVALARDRMPSLLRVEDQTSPEAVYTWAGRREYFS